LTEEPLVSCIVIFLNEERYLAEAIESIRAQTYPSWEIVLVDDGSTDRSADIARDYARRYPDRIRSLAHPGRETLGMSASRNLGLAEARGRYLGFLDADDVWEPNKLREQVGLLEMRPDVGMVYGRTLLWHGWRGESAAIDEFCDLGVPPDSTLLPPASLELLIENRAQTPTTCNALFRREVIDRLGGFEPAFRGMFEDQVLFMKIGLAERVFVSSQCWARYRQRADSHSSRAAAAGEVRAARLRLLDWLAAYLEREGVRSSRIQRVLRRQRRSQVRPRLQAFFDRARELAWRLGRAGRALRSSMSRGPSPLGESATTVRDAIQPSGRRSPSAARPVVSIVMPFLNAEAYLADAIESVRRQSFESWELLLVDDGSTDGSTACALRHAERDPDRVRYLAHPERTNLGAGPSRNLGISQAAGEFLCFLDADDVLLPSKLGRQIHLLREHPSALMVYGSTEYWYSWSGSAQAARRDRRGKLGAAAGRLYRPPALVTAYLRDPGMVPCLCGLVVRRAAVECVGAFDTDIPDLYEDQVLIAKLVLEGPVYIEDGCSERYRQHDSSSSARAVAEGRYHATQPNPARKRFLEWLAGYVSASPAAEDAELRRAIAVAQRPYL
jgi:glycosyltransferase involved in cell wall biosynthesis